MQVRHPAPPGHSTGWQSCLPGVLSFSNDIQIAVKNSATILVFLSTAYLASTWCQDELKMFVDACGGEQQVGGRMFTVRLDDKDDKLLPAVLQQSRVDGYHFYEKERHSDLITRFAQPIPDPDEPDHRPFYRQVSVLAQQLAAQLKKQLERSKMRESVRQSRPTGSGGSTVFLAEVPQELFDVRLEVASYLQQSHPTIRVVPDPEQLFQWSSASAQEILDETDRCLEESLLFVQLLDRFPTPRTPDFPAGYAEAQQERAQASGKPVFRRRSRELDLDKVRDPQHKKNLDTNVIAMRLDVMKRTIVERVTYLALPEPDAPNQEDRVEEAGYVLINAHEVDVKLAQEIADKLAEAGVGYDIEPGDASISDMVKKYGYNALMVVYGDCDPKWVPRQVRKFREVLCWRPRGRLPNAPSTSPPAGPAALAQPPAPDVRPGS